MAAEFAFEDKDAQKFLKKMMKNASDVTKKTKQYVDLLSIVVFQDIMKHFASETGSKGAWAKWSDVYRDHMQKIGKGGNKILQDTGRLRGSFIPTNYRVNSDAIVWFNPAKTKSGFPYAAAHDEGGPKLPQRDFMYLSDEAREKIEEQTLKFLEEGL
jgi:phage gpG-like protein